VVTSPTGSITAAKLLLGGTLTTPALASRVRAAAPSTGMPLYLMKNGKTVRLQATGGIPSRERALGDPEVIGTAAWTDTPADGAWTTVDDEDVLRVIDRFHPVPDVPERAGSWAEWLYFNGRSAAARFYLTFLVGGPERDGRRSAGVRLQLERDGRMQSFSARGWLTEADVASAPDLTVGGNRVRLAGRSYRLSLDLEGSGGSRASGEVTIGAVPGRQMPPIEIRGARGWRTGYVVPVMSGPLAGHLVVDGERISLDDGVGYHDHNWGFWQGVSWQWGQVQHGDLSIVYGRVFPPADAADPARMPGFLGVIGPDGPLGYATRVTIEEENVVGTSRPEQITISGRSSALDLTLRFLVRSIEVNRFQGAMQNGLNFLQMRGEYVASGKVGDRRLEFEAAGSAETFRSVN
jgi:hypothetical protein